MKKQATQCFTVPVVQLESETIDRSSYCPPTGVSSSCNGKANSVAQRVSKNKPPLLKSSRGRRQVLPMKFSDSVLHSWKKEKSECSDDLKSCLADNGEYAQNVPRNKKLKREESAASYDDIYLVKKPRVERPLDFRLKNIILEPYPRAKKSVKEKVVEKKADFYEPGDFVMGDIVWAKCGKNFPAWPAIVIDPLWQAPEAVLRACVPGTLCVMFYGYSRSGQRLNFLHLAVITEGLGRFGGDYAWIKAGMVFPFHEYMGRFQGQTKLYGSKPSDFHLAIEEAILAENGYADSAMEAGQDTLPVTNHGSAEATGSNQESECTIQQASLNCA
ncbi:UNVERIFIED_CONTAM: Histone-lysine N-methyltransferase ATX4 [Sesamum latifolium]|uniref:Histone-lysine N-methyltransferase ATX4 n=1 Tax=Sesamum latifolium TaxID=2727402 RepID=A0AAW2U6C0_9LAMI